MPTGAEPRERPIIFSGPMVRAVRDGRKTQTRRVVNRNPPFKRNGNFEWYPGGEKLGFHASNGKSSCFDVPGGWAAAWCPYGAPGARLWLRETWGEKACREYDPSGAFSCDTGERRVVYRADGNGSPDNERWRPPAHMPRWASRVTLEITGVRVERLNAITDADAIAEGARRFGDIPLERFHEHDPAHADRWSMDDNPPTTGHCLGTPRFAFANLWDRLNGKRHPWASDPFVWVVSFRRDDR